MSEFGNSVRRAVAVIAAAVCVICGATALVCGVYISMRGINPGAVVNEEAVFYLSGECTIAVSKYGLLCWPIFKMNLNIVSNYCYISNQFHLSQPFQELSGSD